MFAEQLVSIVDNNVGPLVAMAAPLRWEISGRADLGRDRRQIAWASSVNASATRSAGVVVC
jgi:hypothetical protein